MQARKILHGNNKATLIQCRIFAVISHHELKSQFDPVSVEHLVKVTFSARDGILARGYSINGK